MNFGFSFKALAIYFALFANSPRHFSHGYLGVTRHE